MKTSTMLMLLASLLTGCALRARTHFDREVPLYRRASLEQLLRRLSTGSAELNNVKAKFSAALTDQTSGRKQTCRGMLALARPDKLRMKASRAMLPTFFDLLCDGDDVTLFVPSEDTVYRGGLRDDTISGALLDARVLSGLLWGGGEGDEAIHFLEADGPHYVLYSVVQNGKRGTLMRKVFFERADLDPVRFCYFDTEGNCVRDIRCSDFFAAGPVNAIIPQRIVIKAPSDGREISLHLSDILANSRLNPRLFTFESPPDVTVLPLEDYR